MKPRMKNTIKTRADRENKSRTDLINVLQSLTQNMRDGPMDGFKRVHATIQIESFDNTGGETHLSYTLSDEDMDELRFALRTVNALVEQGFATLTRAK